MAYNYGRGFSLNTEMTEAALNSAINDELQPNRMFNLKMGSAVDQICAFFREKMQPSEVVKGGSLGKGTAIKGDADIDLVIILNNVKSVAELRSELPSIKRRIRNHLEGARFAMISSSVAETAFAVKFTINVDGERIDIDLLPTFEFSDTSKLYREMVGGSNAMLPYYSAAVVKLQVDFVKAMPANVKNLIRLVKYWNKNYAKDNTSADRQPTSYAMELITINAWENRSSPSQFDMRRAFRGVMERLRNVDFLYVLWDRNYHQNMIPSDIRCQRPLLLDPANPTNNLYETYKWDKVKRAAVEACQSALLRNISSW